jgi:hypothetical protein
MFLITALIDLRYPKNSLSSRASGLFKRIFNSFRIRSNESVDEQESNEDEDSKESSQLNNKFERYDIFNKNWSKSNEHVRLDSQHLENQNSFMAKLKIWKMNKKVYPIQNRRSDKDNSIRILMIKKFRRGIMKFNPD